MYESYSYFDLGTISIRKTFDLHNAMWCVRWNIIRQGVQIKEGLSRLTTIEHFSLIEEHACKILICCWSRINKQFCVWNNIKLSLFVRLVKFYVILTCLCNIVLFRLVVVYVFQFRQHYMYTICFCLFEQNTFLLVCCTTC